LIFSWLKKRRRKKLLAARFPPAWLDVLRKNVRHYAYLSSGDQAKLRGAAVIIAAEKEWVGCNGLEITDEVKITIAAQAGLLLLGGPGRYYFDEVLSILVYPDAFRGEATTDATFGEAWPQGPVILSWEHVLHGGKDPRDGLNVVLHEFAHKLDGLEGGMHGTPPLGTRRQYRRWREVAEREYLRLVNRTDRGEITLLNDYGASNRAEFFAVATECFFEQPVEMKHQHPDLYDIFADFYHQDPATWFPGRKELTAPPEEDAGDPYEVKDREVDVFADSHDSADTCFTRGLVFFSNGEFVNALAEFDRAIHLEPEDGEIHLHRGMAHLELKHYDRAVSDCTRTLDLSPDSLEPHRTRALAYDALEKYDLAIQDWSHLIRNDPDDAEACYYRGLAHADLENLEEAVSDFTEAIRNEPGWAEPYLERSRAFERLVQIRKARADLEEAMRRDPDLAPGPEN